MKPYRYIAQSVGGFIQQAAVCYVQHSYWFYVVGQIPKGKNPLEVDQKILNKYQINISKDQRYRRKKEGIASVQYLRYQDTFILLATDGKHLIFDEEKTAIQDVRVSPIRVFGYAIIHKNSRVLVSLEERNFRHIKADFSRLALNKNPKLLWWKFKRLPFEPYQPVYRQIRSIWNAVNRQRKTAGLPRIPYSALRTRRRSYRPFDSELEARSSRSVRPIRELKPQS